MFLLRVLEANGQSAVPRGTVRGQRRALQLIVQVRPENTEKKNVHNFWDKFGTHGRQTELQLDESREEEVEICGRAAPSSGGFIKPPESKETFHVNQAKTHRALLAGKFLLLVNASVRPKPSKAL